MEAVKQVEILFAMAIGVLAFGEAQRVRESALGAAVMLLGMVLLALAASIDTRLSRSAGASAWRSALGERGQEALGQLGRLAEQGGEVAALDDEQAQRRLGDDAGRARAAVEQAHLAEVLAGLQPRALARGDLDAGAAVEDQEELLAGLRRRGPARCPRAPRSPR